MESLEEINFQQEYLNDETRQRLNSIVSYLRLFNSPLPNKAPIFSASEAPSFRTLYTFRSKVTEWSFSVSMYDNYVRLLQKSKNALFLFSNEEHVLAIELHHETLIIIMVESEATKKIHNIVLDTIVPTATFNIEGLLGTIQNTQCESIRDRLTTIPSPKEDGSPLLPLILYQQL